MTNKPLTITDTKQRFVRRARSGLGRAKLRVDSALLYVTHMDLLTIEGVHTTPPFDTVPLSALKRWAAEDDWEGQREQHVRAWQAEAKRRIASRQAQARVDDLSSLEEMITIGMDKIRGRTVEPRSLEGLMKVVSELFGRREELREAIGGEFVSPSTASAGLPSSQAPTGMNVQTMEAAARAALEIKRAALRGLPAPSPAAAVGLTPQAQHEPEQAPREPREPLGFQEEIDAEFQQDQPGQAGDVSPGPAEGAAGGHQAP